MKSFYVPLTIKVKLIIIIIMKTQIKLEDTGPHSRS